MLGLVQRWSSTFWKIIIIIIISESLMRRLIPLHFFCCICFKTLQPCFWLILLSLTHRVPRPLVHLTFIYFFLFTCFSCHHHLPLCAQLSVLTLFFLTLNVQHHGWIPSIKPIPAHSAFMTVRLIDPQPAALWRWPSCCFSLAECEPSFLTLDI